MPFGLQIFGESGNMMFDSALYPNAYRIIDNFNIPKGSSGEKIVTVEPYEEIFVSVRPALDMPYSNTSFDPYEYPVFDIVGYTQSSGDKFSTRRSETVKWTKRSDATRSVDVIVFGKTVNGNRG